MNAGSRYTVPAMSFEGIEARRAVRARERRRRQRRRRVAAVGAFVLVVAAATAIALASSGGGSASRKVAQTKRAPAHHSARTSAPKSHGSTVTGTATGKPGNVSVPVLMYHVIAPPPANAPFPLLYVPAPEFATQMQALAGAGYHAVTLDRVWAAWHGRGRLPPRPVVISFDNGYRTQFTRALPVLRRLHWAAVENLQLSGLPPVQGGLLRREIRTLVADGWELDTQGWSHADLIRLGPRALRFQVAVARRRLRRLYDVPVHWFCYPSGHYDASVIAMVRDAGFLGSTTVVPGWASRRDDAYRLPRLRVPGGTSGSALLALIAGTRGSPPPPPAYG
jgi:peptidoglycan/xylan/chitin deacetylase (PgdA/CDA1 family)